LEEKHVFYKTVLAHACARLYPIDSQFVTKMDDFGEEKIDHNFNIIVDKHIYTTVSALLI
jgi:hypothetical protein